MPESFASVPPTDTGKAVHALYSAASFHTWDSPSDECQRQGAGEERSPCSRVEGAPCLTRGPASSCERLDGSYDGHRTFVRAFKITVLFRNISNISNFLNFMF